MKSLRPEGPPHLHLVTGRREKGVPKLAEEELIAVGDTREWNEGFNEQMFTIDMARQFLELSTAERAGKLRLEEARLQNVLGRAWHAGLLPNPEKFQRNFKDVLNALSGTEPIEIEGKPITRYATEALDGVAATLEVIRQMEKAFAARRSSPEQRQLIATNDRLDAGDKIDLVEVIYRAGTAGPSVDEIRLVQVKRSVQPTIEIEKIVKAHERFMQALISEETYRASKRSLEARRMADILRRQFSLQDVRAKSEAMFARIGGIAGDRVEDGQIEDAVAAANLPVAVLKTWLADQDPKLRAATRFMLEAVGVATARVGVLGERLARWAAEHPASSAELAAVLPGGSAAAAVVGAANFESVVVHGGKIEKKLLALRPGERKALTAA